MALPYYLNPKPNPDILMSDRYVIFDFETTSIEKGSALNQDNRLLMSAWYSSWDDQYHYIWGDEYSQSKLIDALRQADVIVAHNSKFEWHWLARMGMEYGERMTYDTMLGDYVIAGNRKMPFDLEACCARHGVAGKESVVKSLMESKVFPEDIPKDWVIEYGIEDVRATHELFLKQREALYKCGMLPVMFTRCIQTPVLASIESKGMLLDKDRVIEEHEEYSARLAEINEELYDIAGDINFNSSKQVAEFLYDELKIKELKKHGKPDRTAGGARKADLSTIQSLKCTNKKQRKVQSLLLEQSKVSSALSKSLTLYRALCEQRDGVLYGNFMQHRTATHRLSSTGRKLPLKIDGKIIEKGVQLQNQDRKFKRLVKARDNKIFLDVDFASLEFRTAGIAGNDSQIRQDVLNGVDVHTNCMNVLNEAGMNLDRTGAKAWTFRYQYSIPKENRKNEPTLTYGHWYKNRYHELASTQQEWLNDALRHKKVKTPLGMLFHFPFCRLTESGYIEETNKVLNYPIQGLGAEIMCAALVYAYWNLGDIADIVVTVHDSILFELAEEHLEEAAGLVSKSLLDEVYRYMKNVYDMDLTTPLGLGFTIGSHWAQNSMSEETLEKYAESLRNQGYTRAKSKGDEIVIDFHESS